MANEQNIPNGLRLGNVSENSEAELIAVLGEADGNGHRIVGYILRSALGGAFVPLAGTEVGSPVTETVEFVYGKGLKSIYIPPKTSFQREYDFYIQNDAFNFTKKSIDEDIDDVVKLGMNYLIFREKATFEIINTEIPNLDLGFGMYIVLTEIEIEEEIVLVPQIFFGLNGENALSPYLKGILGNQLFNKQNDPNAFAQLGDVGVAGSFSGIGTATTVFTVAIGLTQPNNTYKANVTPTSAYPLRYFM